MADNKEVEIKIVADTSDVDKSMKQVSKSADKMGKDIEKAGDKAEDAFDGLEKSIKDINKQMKNMFKNMNMNGFTNSINKAMKQAKQTVSNTAKSMTKIFDAFFGKKRTLEVNGKTTTDASSGAGNGSSLAGSIITGGAMGSQIVKQLSLIRPAMEKVKKSFKDLPQQLQTDMSKAIIDINDDFQYVINVTESLKDIGFDFSDDRKDLKGIIKGLKDSALIKFKSPNLKETFGTDKFLESLMLIPEELDVIERKTKALNKIEFSLDLDDELVKLDALFQKYENKPLKVNATQIINQFTTLKQKMEELDMDTSFMDEMFDEWENGTKSALELGNAMRSVRNSFDALQQGVQKSIQSQALQVKKQRELENSTNRLQRTLVQAKYGYKSFTDGIKNLSSSMKSSYKSLQETRKKAKELGDEVQKTGSKIKSASQSMTSSFQSMAKALAPYLGLAAIFGGLKKSITSYTDSLQDSSQFGLIFGNEAQNMTDWLENLNSTVTASKSTLMDFSSNLFRMGKNMGVSTDDTIEMTKAMTELSADLIALKGEGVMDALAGALRGEYDSIQNFGYTLDDASVRARALAMGLDDSSESAKLFARQAILMEQSADILGYGAIQAQTLGGQLQMLQKNFTALGASIGSCFAGILQVVLPVLNSIVVAVTDAFNKIAKVINAIFGIFGIKVGGASASGGTGGGAIGDAVGNIGGALADGLDEASGGASDVADDLASGAESAKEIAKGLMGIDELNVLSSDKGSGGSGGGSGSGSSGGAGGSGGAGIGAIGDVVTSAEEGSNVVKKTFEELEGWMKDLVNGFVAVFNMLKAGWQSVGDYISTSIANLKQAFSNLGQSIKDFLINAWNNGGAELVFNFGRLAGAITGAIIDISGRCIQMVADLFAHLDPSKNKYTQAFIEGLNDLLIECENFALKAGGWFETFVDNGGQAFLNVMGDIVMILGTTLAKTFANIVKWITMFMDSWAGQTLIKACAITLNVLAGALKAVLIIVEKLSPVWSALLVAMGAKATVTGIITLLGKMKKGLIDVGLAIAASLEATLLWVYNGLSKLVTVLSTCISATLKFAASLLQGVWSAIVSAASGMSTYIMSLMGVIVAEGGATAGAVALKTVLDALGIGLLIAAIVALITVVIKIGEKFGWWKAIGEALGNMFDWLGEKLGWIWDKITGFFGWEEENKIEPEVEETGDSLDGLGDTMEEVSDRFGTSVSAINQSLSSIGIDSNKIALQLDEAEAMFNDKFNMISANAKEYLDAVTSGNEDMLKEMAGDADKYTAEIKSAFEDMSLEEQAVFYSTYGEINGVTDGWLDYTKGSYEDCLIKHSAMLESISKNENLSYDEKLKRIDEEKEAFVTAQNEKVRELNLAIADIESAEGISEEQRYALLQDYTAKRDQLVQEMEDYQLGSIDTVEKAVEESAKLQGEAYDGVGNSQEEALKDVDTALETTKGNLATFKEESDKTAREIPKEWEGVGEDIGKEFEGALDSVESSMTGILSNTKKQCEKLKGGLEKTFDNIKSGVKKSMVDVNKTITSKFTEAVNSVERIAGKLKDGLQKTFQTIASGISTSLNNIKQSMSTSFSQVVNSINTAMQQCKSQISTTLTQVNTDVNTKTGKIVTIVGTNLKDVKSKFTKPFTDSKNSISQALSEMNTTISSRLGTIVNTLKTYATRMKNTMNFKFPTPYLKMPHISVYGDWNFEKKTVPSFRVNWWSSGAIFNKRTILGNMGVGDAQNGYGNNPEAVLPLDSLWKELGEQFDKQNKTLAQQNGNITIHNVVELDGEVVARNVHKHEKQMTQMGKMNWDFL